MTLGSGSETDLAAVYDEYVRKYGRDNADYLMEVMGAWRRHYKRAAYVDMGVGDGAQVEADAATEATRRGWVFDKLAGDLVLLRRLLDGDWERDFLVLKPGEQVRMTYDEGVIGCGSVEG